jgi:hypothetical protein
MRTGISERQTKIFDRTDCVSQPRTAIAAFAEKDEPRLGGIELEQQPVDVHPYCSARSVRNIVRQLTDCTLKGRGCLLNSLGHLGSAASRLAGSRGSGKSACPKGERRVVSHVAILRIHTAGNASQSQRTASMGESCEIQSWLHVDTASTVAVQAAANRRLMSERWRWRVAHVHMVGVPAHRQTTEAGARQPDQRSRAHDHARRQREALGRWDPE